MGTHFQKWNLVPKLGYPKYIGLTVLILENVSEEHISRSFIFETTDPKMEELTTVCLFVAVLSRLDDLILDRA